MSISKIKAPSDLWERCERKLLVYIMEGISLVTKHGAGNPFVKLIYDKQKHKTQTLKHAEDVSWKEMFMFEVTDDTTELILEVYTKAGLASGDKLIGSCRVCVPSELQPEEVIDRVVDLEIPSTTKAKHKEMLDSRMGNIHLRMLFSKEREYPIRPPPNQCSVFRYRDHYRNMQTGDLLVFSGVGSVDALSKIHSGTRYSRVGLIVRMPNKWTGKEKLFVFEIGRNLPHELDAFKDAATSGASLFRLFEHIHAVSATDIWWVPLKMPLEQATSANMIDWIKEVVSRKVSVDLPAPPVEMVEFFDRYEMQLVKHPFASAEICSASSMISALRLGGKRFPFEHSYISCVQLMSQDCFGDPILIRERSGVPMPVEPAFGQGDGVGRSSSSALRRATIMSESGGAVGGAIVGSVPAEEGSVAAPASGANHARSGSVNGNTVIAPRVGPIQVVSEPQRVATQVALARPDALPHSFSSQHLANSPSPSPDDSFSDAGSSDAASPALQQAARHASQGSHGAEGYRRPSGAPMPIAPPGPSVLGLPNYQGQVGSPDSSPNNADLAGSESNPFAVPTTHQPSANYVVITTESLEATPHQQAERSPSTEAPESAPPLAGRRSPAALTMNNGVVPGAIPLPGIVPTGANTSTVGNGSAPAGNQAPGSANSGAAAPPETAPKPRFKKDPSRKLRPATAKPGSLASMDMGDAGSADNPSDGSKPRLLPAPSGRSMTMAVPIRPNHLLDAQDGPEEPESPHERQNSNSELGAAPPTLPEKKPKKKKQQPPSTSPPPMYVPPPPTEAPPQPPSKNPAPVEDAATSAPPEPPVKPKKKKTKGVPSLDVEGVTPIVISKKRKSPRKNRESVLAAPDAVREDLDEGTKTELRRRRVGSVRILPETHAAQAWSAAVSGQTPEEGPSSPTSDHDATSPVSPKILLTPDGPGQHQEELTSAPGTPKEVVVSPEAPLKTAMVLWTFEAMADSELNVHEGSTVNVLELAGEWALCEFNGRAGAVPTSFLSVNP